MGACTNTVRTRVTFSHLNEQCVCDIFSLRFKDYKMYKFCVFFKGKMGCNEKKGLNS